MAQSVKHLPSAQVPGVWGRAPCSQRVNRGQHAQPSPPLSEIRQPRARESAREEPPGVPRERRESYCPAPAGRAAAGNLTAGVPPRGLLPQAPQTPKAMRAPRCFSSSPLRPAVLGRAASLRPSPLSVRDPVTSGNLKPALVHGGPQLALCPGAIPARGPWGGARPSSLSARAASVHPIKKRLLSTESKYS